MNFVGGASNIQSMTVAQWAEVWDLWTGRVLRSKEVCCGKARFPGAQDGSESEWEDMSSKSERCCYSQESNWHMGKSGQQVTTRQEWTVMLPKWSCLFDVMLHEESWVIMVRELPVWYNIQRENVPPVLSWMSPAQASLLIKPSSTLRVLWWIVCE